MNGKCNKIALDTAALLDDLTDCAAKGLSLEGGRLIKLMRREAHRTVDGGAPGKPAWRDEIADNIAHVSTAITDKEISMEFGYVSSSEAERIRAMVVTYGSGDKAEGGGVRIKAGPPGRTVWDGDLASKHRSRAKSEHELPDAFNQQGNQFVQNAMRMMRTVYGGRLSAAFTRLPWDVICKRAKVQKP